MSGHTRQKNNVYTDSKGDVYRNNNGSWQKNTGKDWESVQSKQGDRTARPSVQDRSSSFNHQQLDRQSAARQRGTQYTNNRSTVQRSMPSGGDARMGGGGGFRR